MAHRDHSWSVAALLLPAGLILGVVALIGPDGWGPRLCGALAGLMLGVIGIIRLRRQEGPDARLGALLDQALDACPQGVVITDPRQSDNPIIYVNQGFLAMTGYSREEVIGRNCRFLQSGEAVPAIKQSLRESLKAGRPFMGLMANQRKDGTPFWNRLTIAPVHDQAGRLIHFIGVQMDATIEIEAERRLRRNEERFRSVVEVLDEGIVLQALDGTIVESNAAASRILGLSVDQLHGRSSLDPRWRALREDGSDFPGPEHPAMVTLRTGLPQHGVIMGVDRPDGGRVWLSINSQPLRHADESRHWAAVTTFTDITPLRDREATLRNLGAFQRAILDGADRSIIATATDGTIRLFNAGAERLLGWKAAEVVDKVTPAIIHDGDEVVRRAAELSVELGRPIAPGFEVFVAKARLGFTEEREWTYLRRDGSRVPVSLSVTALRDGSGAITAFLGVANDISARKEYERALHDAKEAAEAGARAKADFLATMSHEIRTPMNGVIGVAGLLLDTSLDATQREYAETIRSSGDALLTLINDILDFSKIEAGRLDLEDAVFDPRQIAEEAVGLLAERAHDKGLELVLDLDPALPSLIRGDPGRLRQVLVNLVGNAVKFTERGEVVVSGEVRASDAGVSVVWSVRDTGIGIPRAAQARLFQVFAQADASTTRRYGGTGLGLAISLRLVQAMGGTIAIASEPGQGATFTVVVPLVAAGPMPAALRDAGRFRLLVMDAHQPTRRAIVRALATCGLAASEAASSGEALDRLVAAQREGRSFAALFCCRRSADGDDWPLVRLVRQDARFAALPILLSSSLAERPEAELLARHRIRTCLVRPLRHAALRAGLERELLGVADEAQQAPAARTTWTGRVLVAEDHAVNQRVVTAICQRLGLRVEIAANGLEAVAAATQRPFDLILMDCQMPEMDGFAATAELRRRLSARIPIIALTANGMAGDRERCLAAGMDDHIAKPVRIEDIDRLARRWLSGDTLTRPLTGDAVEPLPVADFDAERMTRLLADLGGEVAELRAVVEPFMDSMPQELAKLRQAMLAGPDAAKGVAHRIKGVALLFGAARLVQLMQRIEKDGQDVTAEAEQTWERTRPQLVAWLSRLLYATTS